MFCVVALAGQSARKSRQIESPPPIGESPGHGADDTVRAPSQRQKQVRLRPEQVDELVEAYVAGALQQELCTRFGIHDTTLRAHLRRRGALKRRPYRKLRGDLLEEARRLYADGLSLRAVASEVGVSREAVRSGLLASGDVLRRRGSAS